jgi:hypothetical protein
MLLASRPRRPDYKDMTRSTSLDPHAARVRGHLGLCPGLAGQDRDYPGHGRWQLHVLGRERDRPASMRRQCRHSGLGGSSEIPTTRDAHRPRAPPPHRRWRPRKALLRRAGSREPPREPNFREPGSARRPRGPGSTRSPSRACGWPCLRGCAGARSRPGDDRHEAWGQALIASRTRARGVRTAERPARRSPLVPLQPTADGRRIRRWFRCRSTMRGT